MDLRGDARLKGFALRIAVRVQDRLYLRDGVKKKLIGLSSSLSVTRWQMSFLNNPSVVRG